MAYQINLEQADADGAVREAAEAVGSDTRLDFLRKGAIGGGAVVGGGALLSALTPAAALAAGGRPPKSFGKADIGILNYALTLEYLEAAFYAGAIADARTIKNGQLKAFATKVAKDEAAHVAYLKAALGSKAAKKPKFDFKGTNTNEAMFAATAQVLENTGVGAYFGQGFNIKSAKVLKAAISILTIEARHAGAIGLYNDPSAEAISPSGAFDKPTTAGKVLAAVKGTGFIVG